MTIRMLWRLKTMVQLLRNLQMKILIWRYYYEGPIYIEKDGQTQWAAHCPNRNRRTPSRNIVRHLPHVRQSKPESAKEPWNLFITESVLYNIIKYINQRIEKVRLGYVRQNYARDTTRSEMEAFIGLLYLAGVYRTSHVNLKDLWETDGFGIEFFRTTMDLKRFQF